ncbi:sigma-54-dependent transcriptional regulator [Oricola sp.]|uniref:sigma-54-dependent transcriptional regulator n=1 Tax=Oricola sp. TaxID=1979950 RepID=UPI003BACCE89
MTLASASILIVDDDPVQRRLLEAAISRAGHTAYTVDGGKPALAALTRNDPDAFDAVLLDLRMPDIDGLAVMAAMKEHDIDIPVIVLTAQGGIDVVIAAMRAGAFDFLVKPVSPDRLNAAVRDAVRLNVKQSERKTTGHPGAASSVQPLVAQSEVMDRVKLLIAKAAATDFPVLIEGESGVGKELIARAIQAGGARRKRPFIVVNCGAIPENLIESILFGHEKGAFTGATERHTGKFIEADGGTLFLDEVGELPLAAQVKLLRAIQEGEVEPVGSKTVRKVDLRVISATNRDLIAEIKRGRFREDLFYRLNVFPILVPSLRQRGTDIALLVDHFIAMSRQRETGFRARGIKPDALALLRAHDWPGNVRQLQNAVFRAMVLCDGDMLEEADFPQIAAQVHGIDPRELSAVAVPEPEPQSMDEPGGRDYVDAPGIEPSDDTASAWYPVVAGRASLNMLDETGNVRALSDIESDAIAYAIEHYDGQMSEVARRLGIGRSTLYRKLKEYDLG